MKRHCSLKQLTNTFVWVTTIAFSSQVLDAPNIGVIFTGQGRLLPDNCPKLSAPLRTSKQNFDSANVTKRKNIKTVILTASLFSFFVLRAFVDFFDKDTLLGKIERSWFNDFICMPCFVLPMSYWLGAVMSTAAILGLKEALKARKIVLPQKKMIWRSLPVVMVSLVIIELLSHKDSLIRMYQKFIFDTFDILAYLLGGIVSLILMNFLAYSTQESNTQSQKSRPPRNWRLVNPTEQSL